MSILPRLEPKFVAPSLFHFSLCSTHSCFCYFCNFVPVKAHWWLLKIPTLNETDSQGFTLKFIAKKYKFSIFFNDFACVLDARDEELMRSEMISLLATKPSTFSSLTDHTPQSHESHTGKKSVDYINMLHRILDTYAAKKEGKKNIVKYCSITGSLAQLLKHCYRFGRSGIRFSGRTNLTQCRQCCTVSSELYPIGPPLVTRFCVIPQL